MFRAQFVFASAMFAALFLGGAQANAGYVSVAAMAAQDGARLFPLWVENEARSGMADAQGTLGSPFDNENSNKPSEPVSSLTILLQTPYHFGYGNGQSSGSSNSTSGSGSSTYPVGDLSPKQAPPLVATSLLVSQTGDAHPFSISSSLFRPPRAA